MDAGGTAAPLFTNARHVIQQDEWDYWARGLTKSSSDRAALLDPVVEAGLVDFVSGEHAVTQEVVTLPTPGHTPGHVSFLLSSGEESVVVLGDVAHSPMQVSEPEWCIGPDVDRASARASRRELFDRSAGERVRLATNHFPWPSLVVVGGVRRWEGAAGS